MADGSPPRSARKRAADDAFGSAIDTQSPGFAATSPSADEILSTPAKTSEQPGGARAPSTQPAVSAGARASGSLPAAGAPSLPAVDTPVFGTPRALTEPSTSPVVRAPMIVGKRPACVVARHEPPQSEQAMPGRDLDALPQHLVQTWGACFRCNKEGHFQSNCPFVAKVFPARFAGHCSACGGGIAVGQETTKGSCGSWVHARCELGRTKQHVHRERQAARQLRAPTELPAAGAAESTEALAVRTALEGREHLMVVAVAGAGKTSLLCAVDCALREAGGAAVCLAFGRDATTELARRGVRMPSTFHSLGLRAWRCWLGRQRAAARRGGGGAPIQVTVCAAKSKLVLGALYPVRHASASSAPSGAPGGGAARSPPAPSTVDVEPAGSRSRHSLTHALYAPFVARLVSVAKQRLLRAEGHARSDGAEWHEQLARAAALLLPRPHGPSARRRRQALEVPLQCIAHELQLGARIERQLRPGGMSASRVRRASQAWPTAGLRLAHGVRLAAETLLASMEVSTQHEWAPAPGRPALAALAAAASRAPRAAPRRAEQGSPADGAKGEAERAPRYALPCVDFDDQLLLPLLPLRAPNDTAADTADADADALSSCALACFARAEARSGGLGAYSHVLCDEVQDSNSARQAMLGVLLRARGPAANGGRGARLVAVGDSMQAIFGFAGADASALDSVAAMLAPQPVRTLHLSACHRCPRAHLALANALIDRAASPAECGEYAARGVAHAEPAAGAAEGEVVQSCTFSSYPLGGGTTLVARAAARGGGGGGSADPVARAPPFAREAVLCRSNAPLVALSFALAARGVCVRALGRPQLRARVLRLFDALCPPSTLEQSSAEEVAAHARAAAAGAGRLEEDEEDEDEDDGHNGEPEARADGERAAAPPEYARRDLAACILTIAEHVLAQAGADGASAGSAARVRDAIGQRFGSPLQQPADLAASGSADGARHACLPPDELAEQHADAPVLSTVHKAKGLEFGTVYLLEPAMLPLPSMMDKGGWQARQELNLTYVACTRARTALRFLADVHFHQGGGRAALEALFCPPAGSAGSAGGGGGDAAGARPRPRRGPRQPDFSRAWSEFARAEREEEARRGGDGPGGADEAEAAMSEARARELLAFGPAASLTQAEVIAATRSPCTRTDSRAGPLTSASAQRRQRAPSASLAKRGGCSLRSCARTGC